MMVMDMMTVIRGILMEIDIGNHIKRSSLEDYFSNWFLQKMTIVINYRKKLKKIYIRKQKPYITSSQKCYSSNTYNEIGYLEKGDRNTMFWECWMKSNCQSANEAEKIKSSSAEIWRQQKSCYKTNIYRQKHTKATSVCFAGYFMSILKSNLTGFPIYFVNSFFFLLYISCKKTADLEKIFIKKKIC